MEMKRDLTEFAKIALLRSYHKEARLLATVDRSARQMQHRFHTQDQRAANKPDRHLAFKGKESCFSAPNATNLKVKGKVTTVYVTHGRYGNDDHRYFSGRGRITQEGCPSSHSLTRCRWNSRRLPVSNSA